MSTADLANLVARLEVVVERFESKAAGGGDAGSQGGLVLSRLTL